MLTCAVSDAAGVLSRLPEQLYLTVPHPLLVLAVAQRLNRLKSATVPNLLNNSKSSSYGTRGGTRAKKIAQFLVVSSLDAAAAVAADVAADVSDVKAS